MSEFIQLHILTSYPPSNLNRDDLGRPKTAMMGGTQRLRVSSQSLKRAWRESDIFKDTLSDHIGIRTKEMGVYVYKALTTGCSLEDAIKNGSKITAEVPEEIASEWAEYIAFTFGKASDKKILGIEQLAHFSPEEIVAIEEIITKILSEDDTLIEILDKLKKEKKKEAKKRNYNKIINLLRKEHTAVDIAMFGRMLASSPMYNTEAAVQVSHAITVHKVAVEDDYFTAVDDLNKGEENAGAGHVGDAEFASGLFYNYVCINRTLLAENLGGDEDLVNKTLRSLVEAAAKVAPTGKQNSFASRAYASYIRAEKGIQQPRSLSVAFLKALNGKDLLDESIFALRDTNEKIEKVYGKCSKDNCEMNVHTGEGSLSKILDFITA